MVPDDQYYIHSINLLTEIENRILALETAIGKLGAALNEDDSSMVGEWDARIRSLELEIVLLREKVALEEDG